MMRVASIILPNPHSIWNSFTKFDIYSEPNC